MGEARDTCGEGGTPVFGELQKNRAWYEKRCAACADVKFRRMRPCGRECLAIYVEGTTENLELERILSGARAESQRSAKDRILSGERLAADGMGLLDYWPLGTLEEGLRALLAGNLILLADGETAVFQIASRGYPGRAVAETTAEKVLRGSNEGLTESVKVNVALIRKRIRSTDLKVEEQTIGRRTDTPVTLLYMEGIVRPQVVEMMRSRLEDFEVDGVLDGGVLEQLVQGDMWTPFPQMQPTKRCDLAAMELLNGRAVLLSDNSPDALIFPADFHSFLKTSEDQYRRFEIASFERLIRYAALFLALHISGLYLAFIGFHTQILPTNLVLSFAEARRGVPFPSILEVFLMELAFEMIREAGIRMPGALGGTIGIVGGLIIGDAAVSANLVSPMTVVVVAVSALSSFAVPNEEFAAALRLIKYGIILAGGCLGMFGVAAADYLLFCHLAGLTSFGMPYLASFVARGVPGYRGDGDGLIRRPGKLKIRRGIFAERWQRIRLKFRK